MARALITDAQGAVGVTLAGWLARYWKLDMGNHEDRDMYGYASKRLNDALLSGHAPLLLTEFQLMYNRLQIHRRLRGKVMADEKLDDWIAAFRICAEHVARHRAGL